jgi:diacylglycerol kinase (ATP)
MDVVTPCEGVMMRTWLMARGRSVGYAVAGVAHLVRTQPNARIHLGATGAVLALGGVLRVSAGGWCWLIVAMVGVWMAEALNTAVELLADAACPEHHPLIGRAKDVAAGGVLLAAAGAVGIGVLVFGPVIWASWG